MFSTYLDKFQWKLEHLPIKAPTLKPNRWPTGNHRWVPTYRVHWVQIPDLGDKLSSSNWNNKKHPLNLSTFCEVVKCVDDHINHIILKWWVQKFTLFPSPPKKLITTQGQRDKTGHSHPCAKSHRSLDSRDCRAGVLAAAGPAAAFGAGRTAAMTRQTMFI